MCAVVGCVWVGDALVSMDAVNLRSNPAIMMRISSVAALICDIICDRRVAWASRDRDQGAAHWGNHGGTGGGELRHGWREMLIQR